LFAKNLSTELKVTIKALVMKVTVVYKELFKINNDGSARFFN
jgi:hypothetical protein